MKFTHKLILAAIATVAPAVMHAAPITSNPTLSVDGYTFSGFSCSVTKGGQLAFPDNCHEINVNTITSPGVGLQISSGFTALSGSFDDAVIGYHLAAESGVSSIGLDFNGIFEGLAISSVTESVFSGSTLVGFAQVSCGADFGCTRTTTVSLNGTYNNLYVEKDINVSASRMSGALISTVDQTFTATPEPSSMALIGSGLLGAFGLLRRKAKKGVEVA